MSFVYLYKVIGAKLQLLMGVQLKIGRTRGEGEKGLIMDS